MKLLREPNSSLNFLLHSLLFTSALGNAIEGNNKQKRTRARAPKVTCYGGTAGSVTFPGHFWLLKDQESRDDIALFQIWSDTCTGVTLEVLPDMSLSVECDGNSSRAPDVDVFLGQDASDKLKDRRTKNTIESWNSVSISILNNSGKKVDYYWLTNERRLRKFGYDDQLNARKSVGCPGQEVTSDDMIEYEVEEETSTEEAPQAPEADEPEAYEPEADEPNNMSGGGDSDGGDIIGPEDEGEDRLSFDDENDVDDKESKTTYSKVTYGGKASTYTYAGHYWLVRESESGDPLVLFRNKQNSCRQYEVTIDENDEVVVDCPRRRYKSYSSRDYTLLDKTQLTQERLDRAKTSQPRGSKTYNLDFVNSSGKKLELLWLNWNGEFQDGFSSDDRFNKVIRSESGSSVRGRGRGGAPGTRYDEGGQTTYHDDGSTSWSSWSSWSS